MGLIVSNLANWNTEVEIKMKFHVVWDQYVFVVAQLLFVFANFNSILQDSKVIVSP